ncbi:MAG: hypothetical protein LJE92_14550 [Gammaproteobacteria bacterium]|jgi:hypothetical protein|nr:hypothetical protein [Gammaproteobacteria bacterium]
MSTNVTSMSKALAQHFHLAEGESIGKYAKIQADQIESQQPTGYIVNPLVSCQFETWLKWQACEIAWLASRVIETDRCAPGRKQ